MSATVSKTILFLAIVSMLNLRAVAFGPYRSVNQAASPALNTHEQEDDEPCSDDDDEPCPDKTNLVRHFGL